MPQPDYFELADFRRNVRTLYADTMSRSGTLQDTCNEFRRSRDKLFESHPQSALTLKQKQRFTGLTYYDYEPSLRFTVRPEITSPEVIEIPLEADGLTRLQRFARVRFTLEGGEQELSLFWVMGYGGGLFLPFRDATNGRETYGGGRYLLDTIKGADLGMEGENLVLDFNFAFNPSCAYNASWYCPLAPAENTLSIPIRAGELNYPDPV